MDPTLSRVLLSLLKSNPSTSKLPERFPLLFPDKKSTSDSAEPVPSMPPAQVVNVINAGNISKEGSSVILSQSSASDEAEADNVEIPIKIFHPSRKRESKIYMLNLNLSKMKTLKSLQEEILDQLGKSVIKFDLKLDVGWLSGSRRINFTDGDDIRSELKCIKSKSKSLWCDGQRKKIPADSNTVVTIDSDSDGEDLPAPKKQKMNALDAKVLRVDKLANELQQKHGDKCNKIQYKLWAEALDVKKHDSKEFPPDGPIWGSKKSKKAPGGVSEMASAFTHMANSVASAFQPSNVKEVTTPTKETKQSMGISPGKKIDLQDKLLRQIDMIHQMFEKGAVTSQQYEKRRDSLIAQLDQLSEH